MTEHEKQHYLDLLRKYDDYGCFDFPEDESVLDIIVDDIDNLKSTLEVKTGFSFFCISGQDSAFNTILANEVESPPYIGLRLSNFGRLATLTSGPKDKRFFADFEDLPFTESELIDLLAQHNFKYIPLDILYSPYDGVNADFPHIQMLETYYWWDRYFNYT